VNLYWPEHPFRSEARRQRRRKARWAAAERAATKVLVISHGGCLDGIGAVVVTKRALGTDGIGVAYVHPGDMAEVLALYAPLAGKGRCLLIADLSLQPDQADAIAAACRALRANGWRIEWRDHHHKQWEGVPLAALQAELDVLEVNRDATESGASLQQLAYAPDDPFCKTLAAKVRDRDLWWNKDPDSETLEFALSYLGSKEFEAHLVRAPSDGPVVDQALAAAARAERDRQAAVLARMLGEARRFGDGPHRVGVIYGWLPKNTGLHELLQGDCAIAINVRPNGKVSLRSRKEAAVCHLVARDFAGGGHPNASGADLGLRGLGYWWYVVRRGRVARVAQMAERAVQALRTGA
jgi:oligoribonuclease NrnB/cAMP/cGMP phosphodiesterase (DHH superfamily)